MPRLGIVNGHPSLLPRYRGPFPIAWAVRNGETEIGMSFHLMDASFDTGNLLAQTSIPLADDDTEETLFERFPAVVSELLPIVFSRLAAGDRGDPQEGGDYQSMFEHDYWSIDPIAAGRRGAPPGPRLELRPTGQTGPRTVPRARRRAGPRDALEPDRGRGSGGARLRRRAALDRRIGAGLTERSGPVIPLASSERGSDSRRPGRRRRLCRHAGRDRGLRCRRVGRRDLEAPPDPQPLGRGRGGHQRRARERRRRLGRDATPSTPSRAPTTSATRTRSRSSAARRPATSTSSRTGARSSRDATTASSLSARSVQAARREPSTPPTSRATC